MKKGAQVRFSTKERSSWVSIDQCRPKKDIDNKERRRKKKKGKRLTSCEKQAMQSNVRKTMSCKMSILQATKSERFVVSVRGRDGHTAFWLAQEEKSVEKSVSTVEGTCSTTTDKKGGKDKRRDEFENIN